MSSTKKDFDIPSNALRYFPEGPRLGEFDLGGVLYHARYFHIYEDAREKALRDAGAPYPDLVLQGYHLVIVATEQSFHSPLRYGERFEIALWIPLLKRSTFTVRYQLNDHTGTKIHTAMTKHVMVQKRGDEFKATRLPGHVRDALLPIAVSEAD